MLMFVWKATQFSIYKNVNQQLMDWLIAVQAYRPIAISTLSLASTKLVIFHGIQRICVIYIISFPVLVSVQNQTGKAVK